MDFENGLSATITDYIAVPSVMLCKSIKRRKTLLNVDSSWFNDCHVVSCIVIIVGTSLGHIQRQTTNLQNDEKMNKISFFIEIIMIFI